MNTFANCSARIVIIDFGSLKIVLNMVPTTIKINKILNNLYKKYILDN